MSVSQTDASLNNNSPLHDGAAGTRPERSTETYISVWKLLDPKVIDLIYWRDVHRTALLLSSTLVLLFSFVMFSVLSVFAYASLIVMTVTLSFRVYKNVKAAVYKTGEGHPFQRYLDMDISVQRSTLYEWAEQLSGQLLQLVSGLRRLFLVEDLIDSLKFYAVLYLMTYVGSLFNATTLIIIADIALFSLPKIYEVYEVEINELVNMIRAQIRSVSNQVKKSVQAASLKKYM